jgi:pyruvate-ferredoxin/flavodoxin oxidoreductase
VPLEQYVYNETRYRMLQQSDPVRAEELLVRAKQAVAREWAQLVHAAEIA